MLEIVQDSGTSKTEDGDAVFYGQRQTLVARRVCPLGGQRPRRASTDLCELRTVHAGSLSCEDGVGCELCVPFLEVY